MNFNGAFLLGLKNYIDRRIEEKLTQTEVGEDGRGRACVAERKATEQAWDQVLKAAFDS